MKITDVVCHVLVDPDYDITAMSSSQDDWSSRSAPTRA
jgi:hypothetical protein